MPSPYQRLFRKSTAYRLASPTQHLNPPTSKKMMLRNSSRMVFRRKLLPTLKMVLLTQTICHHPLTICQHPQQPTILHQSAPRHLQGLIDQTKTITQLIASRQPWGSSWCLIEGGSSVAYCTGATQLQHLLHCPTTP